MSRDFGVWPEFDQEELDVVTSVLCSGQVNYWTGEEGRKFEGEFAECCGTEHAVALSNGTVALELALRAFEIGPGDEVVVTPRTFIASISAIVMVGASPVFADVDVDSQNITPATVAEVLTDRTRAIIAVHLAGWPCDMDGLMALADKHDLYVIEDCAQAHGAQYKGRPVGGLGHVAAWSFCQDKIITTGGEGGMLTTNDPAIWERAWSFKDHGKAWDAVYNRGHPAGFRWLHESFGTNARMTEMQAAIGRVQLRRLADWNEKRRRNASILEGCFQDIPAFRVIETPESVRHAYYKYYVFVKPWLLREGWDRDRIIEAVTKARVPCFSGSCSEVYLEKAFEGTGLRPEKRLPVAKALGESSLMFLVHSTLSPDEMMTMCRVVCEVMQQAQ
jgi:dTDP-4-amino-4,6-dideoxygalactose transaminase